MTTKHKKKPHSREHRAVLLNVPSTPPTPPAYTATNFPDTRANGGLTFIGHLLPPYDETMPVNRATGGGYYSFDPGAVCWVFTPDNPIGADSNITSAWTDRIGNPAGSVN